VFVCRFTIKERRYSSNKRFKKNEAWVCFTSNRELFFREKWK